MWPRQSHLLSPLKELVNDPKGREIIWTDDLEVAFRELKCMVSEDTLLNYHDWKIPLTVHKYASNKHLGAFVSQNDKYIALFSIKLIKTQRNYNTTEKELLSVVECLNKFSGVLFGY